MSTSYSAPLTKRREDWRGLPNPSVKLVCVYPKSPPDSALLRPLVVRPLCAHKCPLLMPWAKRLTDWVLRPKRWAV